MLIDSPRLTDEDRAAWPAFERQLRRCAPPAWKAAEAERVVLDFIRGSPAYVSVSWGKDSMVVLDLVRGLAPDLPVVWVSLGAQHDNPDCRAVRDAWLDMAPSNYVEVDASPVPGEKVPETGRLKAGFRQAEAMFGPRRISGVRADESATRRMSAAVHGVASDRSCRPILRWSAQQVLGYLVVRDLPIHPVYAMTMGGRMSPLDVRTASIGGSRGAAMGRRIWEQRYYQDILDMELKEVE
jgi:phosphoadenosine phosphosulfate reductase